MSYMLQFPGSSNLPQHILSPPYVLFGINDIDTFSDLPSNIPLALVLHFAPALRKWLLPPPELSKSATHLALRTPFVGINIIADIEVEGLGWILARMMQLANVRLPVNNYNTYMFSPNLLVSIAIHKAWTALELPPKGIEALHVHLQTMLMIGPPVALFEMKGLWHNFPVGSPVLHEMGRNFVRNYIDKFYTPNECSAARHWYLETTERWNFFRALEKQFPAFDNVQKDTMKATNDRQQKDVQIQKIKADVDRLAARLSNGDRKSQNTERDRRAARRRLERAKSIDSISSSTSSVDTVIYNPVNREDSSSSTEEDPTTPTSETSEPVPPHSKPVDSSILVEMLQEMAIEERFQHENVKVNARMDRDRAATGPMNALEEYSNGTHEAQARNFTSISGLLTTDRKADMVEHRTNMSTAVLTVSNDVEGDTYWDAEENLDEMEYIHPKMTPTIEKLKLKLKHNIAQVPKSEMYKTRRFGSSAEARKHSELVEQAVAAATGERSPRSAFETKSKRKTSGDRNLESLFCSGDPIPTFDDGGTPTQSMFPIATLPGSDRAAVVNEPPSHEQVLAEMMTANSRIRRRADSHGDGWTDNRPLSGATSNGADGLLYLQPTVYQGPR